MSEPDSTPAFATPAEKRKWLKENGYQVGARGKLSEEQEKAYASGQPAQEALPGL